MCGEYKMAFRKSWSRKGSPPRVWGILVGWLDEIQQKGITPTCVGNTLTTCSGLMTAEDHPHVCGEYDITLIGSNDAEGSPPRVWGIPVQSVLHELRQRDHPHVCGEYGPAQEGRQRRIGSPPRVWGILSRSQSKENGTGITPTCVGNTGRRRP